MKHGPLPAPDNNGIIDALPRNLTEATLQDACLRSGLHYDRRDTNGGVLYFQARKGT
ncbi:hypothetical protein DSCA_23530 [Desulfosarcina alkanivorans]|uniref:Uncharacterized protein n=1 Tax=Desulfosarcina alkanivorans TaxID=571177 RepID=A0A5K7YIR6_9BACT|nr:hypothetical protein [Desulfosarcina alkanivorans]BBO68423.1 hypothetical protein DSCA_23530 [Desulfosarcina alkanivorans]